MDLSSREVSFLTLIFLALIIPDFTIVAEHVRQNPLAAKNNPVSSQMFPVTFIEPQNYRGDIFVAPTIGFAKAALSECGIVPQEVVVESLEDLDAKLRKAKISKNSLIVIIAHGEQDNSGAFKTLLFRSAVPGEKLILKIREAVENSKANIWYSSCYSGACKLSECVGVSCGANQVTSATAESWVYLSEMICDSVNEKCTLWHKYDQDGNGVLEGAELENYLLHNDWPKSFYAFEGPHTSKEENIDQLKKFCEETAKGKFINTGKTEQFWRLQYVGATGRTITRDLLIPDRHGNYVPHGNKGDVEKFLDSIDPNWRKECSGIVTRLTYGLISIPEKRSHDPASNCSLESWDTFPEVTCLNGTGLVGLPQFVGLSPKLSLPEVRGFSLQSQTCRKKKDGN